MPTRPDPRTFARWLRWFAAAFTLVSAIVAIVFAVRAPDCIGIGISLLGGEDCSNRSAYFLVLAAGVAASICYSVLMFASAYAIELLDAITHGRETTGRD